MDSGQASLSYTYPRRVERPRTVVDSGQASLSYTAVSLHPALVFVVDSGQASLSYTRRLPARRAARVVDSGQASLSYTGRLRRRVHLAVVDSGQASLSYTPYAVKPPPDELWTAGRRHSVILSCGVDEGARRCGQRAGVTQLYSSARSAATKEGCGQRAGVTQLYLKTHTPQALTVVDSGQASLSYTPPSSVATR